MIRGLQWCIALSVAGVLLCLLGLWLNLNTLMALGGGAIATVCLGWPALLFMAVFATPRRR